MEDEARWKFDERFAQWSWLWHLLDFLHLQGVLSDEATTEARKNLLAFKPMKED